MTPKRSISPSRAVGADDYVIDAAVAEILFQHEEKKYAAFNELLNQVLKPYRLHLWALPIATRRNSR